MADSDQDQPVLSAEERDFVGRLNAGFEPPPLTAARRAALDERVRARISEPRWSRWTEWMKTAWMNGNGGYTPALVAVSVAAAALIWVGFPAEQSGPSFAPPLGPTLGSSRNPSSGVEVSRTVEFVEADGREAWTQRLLFGDPTNDTLEETESGLALPPEYAAIDRLFFEG